MRHDYTIHHNAPWGLYTIIIPPGSTPLGTITRGTWDTGALVQVPSGVYVQINAGVLRTLNQRMVREALEQRNDHA